MERALAGKHSSLPPGISGQQPDLKLVLEAPLYCFGHDQPQQRWMIWPEPLRCCGKQPPQFFS